MRSNTARARRCLAVLRPACVVWLLIQTISLAVLPQPANAGHERELRGIWVARFHWKTAGDLAEIVANVKAMGGNAIFFQVRGEADAFYRSRYEPWSARLTGTLGRDPGWDPLQVMIDRAHAAGVEVHAWINTYSAWRLASPPPPSTPPHVLNAHPDWAAVDLAGNSKPSGAEYVALSPGNPAVRQHIADVVADVASRYDVDGIHFDYVRYSGRDFSYDAVSNERLASPKENPRGLSRADWQREQVTELVRRAYAATKAARPRTQVSAAVWGVYQNPWGWPIKNTGYDVYYQDSRDWLRGGAVDFIVPMTYWKIDGMPDFAATVRDFLGATYGRGVYPGLGVFQSWAGWDEVSAQIAFARNQGARGVVLFSYPEALKLASRLIAGPWAHPAITPWSAAAPPLASPTPTPKPPTATPKPPTATPKPPSPTPIPPTTTPRPPTATPIPPTATPKLPTTTPVSPTRTPTSPAATSTPTASLAPLAPPSPTTASTPQPESAQRVAAASSSTAQSVPLGGATPPSADTPAAGPASADAGSVSRTSGAADGTGTPADAQGRGTGGPAVADDETANAGLTPEAVATAGEQAGPATAPEGSLVVSSVLPFLLSIGLLPVGAVTLATVLAALGFRFRRQLGFRRRDDPAEPIPES